MTSMRRGAIIAVATLLVGICSAAGQQTRDGKAVYTYEEIKQMCGLRYSPESWAAKLKRGDSVYASYLAGHRIKGLMKLTTPPNWRSMMGPVEDQHLDPCPLDCWAHSATGVSEGQLHIFLGSNIGIRLNENELVEKLLEDCLEGNTIDAGLRYILGHGVYSDVSGYPNLQGVRWALTDFTTFEGPAEVEAALQSGPLTAGFEVREDFVDFFNNPQNKYAVYRHQSNKLVGAHAVAIVGYGQDAIGGYWICKNSWGSSWADDGYFRIGYNECGIDIAENHQVEMDESCLAKICPDLFPTVNQALSHCFDSDEEWAYVIGASAVSSSTSLPAAGNLRIMAGSSVLFAPGTGLTVQGKMLAEGTAGSPITLGASGSSWSGLILSGSSANNSVLEYVNIGGVQTYGGSAVSVVGASGVTIKHCVISNNANYGTSGIYFGNAGWPEIGYNTISNNGGSGIVLANSYGYIYRDTISANPYGGVYCNGWASPSFGAIGLEAYNGNNTISGGTYGIIACAYSYPYVGTESSTWYGYNTITGGSTARINASGSSEVMAEMNFWGVHPSANWFIAQGGSIIDWQPYLEDPPGSVAAPGDSPVLAEENVDRVDIAEAVRLRTLGEYAQAKSILRGAITTKLQNEVIRRVGPELVALDALTQDSELFEICRAILAKEDILDPVFALAEAKILQQHGCTSEARAKLMNLLIAVGGTEFESQVIHDIGLSEVGSALAGGGLSASTMSLLNGAPDTERMANINWLLSLASTESLPEAPSGPSRALSSDAAPNEISAAAFPNPFNPSTTIRYGLPNRSNVTLTVFNTLGQQVAILVQGEMEAGYHEVKFDATGLSSGVYFYRLQAGDFVQTRKLLLVR